MLKNLLFIACLFSPINIIAQEWTEPINISNMDGTDYFPDITIGQDGTLHCVWVHYFNINHREIYYSFSKDEGDTWSTPTSISKNDTLAVSSPHIVCDSYKNIFVTYEYNSRISPIVVVQTYDGNNWSLIDSIADGYSYSNSLFIDNNDRIYVYWFTGTNMYYRYYENDTWSEIICPYNEVNTNIVIEGEVDSENNLHFVGVYDKYVAYFEYNKGLEQMESPYILTYNNAYEGVDITVDNLNNSHIVWNDIQYHDHATMYIKSSGPYWGTNTFISEKAYQQKIIYSNNTTYIMDVIIESEDSANVTLYQKDNYGKWYGTKTLKTSHWISFMKLGTINNKLFNLFYWRKDDIQYDIYFRKTKYAVGVDEIANIKDIFTLNQNYPNPFSEITSINYNLVKEGFCTLTIHNLEGKLVKTLVSQKQDIGNYTVEWNGKDSKDKKLPSGIYLYCLSLDNYKIAKALIIN